MGVETVEEGVWEECIYLTTWLADWLARRQGGGTAQRRARVCCCWDGKGREGEGEGKRVGTGTGTGRAAPGTGLFISEGKYTYNR